MTPFSSLTNRIFFASAALTILCISTAIYLVNVRVTESAEDELQRALVQTGAVVDQQRATVSDLFAVLARLVADLPKLKAAISTDDPPTVRPIAAEYQREVDSDLFLVTDRSGRVLAGFGPGGASAEGAAAPSVAIENALKGHEAEMFSRQAGAVLQIISVPVTAGAEPPEILGTLSLGFRLDDQLALRFKKLTGSEIAFAAGDRIVASTLPPADRAALQPLVHRKGVSRIAAGGNEYLALLRPLAPSPRSSLLGAPAPRVRQARADDPVPVAIILRSRTERLRLLRPIQAALVATGVVAVLLAIALSYAIARTITSPLAAITDTMKDMAATGDLTKKIAWRQSRWEDEDARLLARTFNTLTGSVTRFQREAADRERLSSLGRLSTVIAHEVRNPLMIIKASLRPLMAGSSSSADIHEAAVDIDEEVTRLNRLVNEVLDFARPLRFELAPADINRICEDSAAAATADQAGVGIHLALDASLPSVVTDAERLRSALVNILVNARHAVVARRTDNAAVASGGTESTTTGEVAGHGKGTGGEQPDIEIRTSAAGGERVAIVVADRGIGIDPSNLSRVFEPYFTTKRAGTGLGLAIARNIIEGLGGSIKVASAPDAGTEVRIELPCSSQPSAVGSRAMDA